MDDEQPRENPRLVGTIVEHPVISGILATVIGASILALIAAASDRLSEPRELEAATTSLSRLKEGINIERFRDELGTPVIVRQIEGEGQFTESLWISDLYAVQTVSDGAGQVALQSVTTRDPDLAPRDRIFGIPLGRQVISGYEDVPLDVGRAVTAWHGPSADWYYSESHQLGSLDTTLVLTASAAGFDQRGDVPDIQCGNALCRVSSQDIERLNRVRTLLTATTVTFVDKDVLPLGWLPEDFRFGPGWEDLEGHSNSAVR